MSLVQLLQMGTWMASFLELMVFAVESGIWEHAALTAAPAVLISEPHCPDHALPVRPFLCSSQNVAQGSCTVVFQMTTPPQADKGLVRHWHLPVPFLLSDQFAWVLEHQKIWIDLHAEFLHSKVLQCKTEVFHAFFGPFGWLWNFKCCGFKASSNGVHHGQSTMGLTICFILVIRKGMDSQTL